MLTIQQASQLTGKSEKTIRRLIKHLLAVDQNVGKNIQQIPFPGGFTYRIDKDYLLAQTQPPTPLATQQSRQEQPQAPPSATQEDTPLLKSKDQTITILTKEIDRLHEEIRELLERDKERNILFHKFQDALMLEAPKGRVDANRLAIQGVTTQDVQEGRQEGQAKQQDTNTNTQQKKSAGKQKGNKPPRKQPQVTTEQVKSSEQAQKKDWLSFLRGK